MMNQELGCLMDTIILLTGIAGTGKRTIGQAISHINPAFTLLHHHDYLDPILKQFDNSPQNSNPDSIWWNLDDKGWDALKKARKAAFDNITYASPKNSSFVITYELLNNNIYHQAIFDEIKEISTVRKSLFIPVRLICELNELIKRLTHPERKQYYKTQDTELIRKRFSSDAVFQSNLKNELTLDVSKLSPEESAKKILAWVDNNAKNIS